MIDKNTEVFLPVQYHAYKQSKINLLKTKMKTVETVERLNRLKKIRKIKNDGRKLLKKTLEELKHYHAKIIHLLPDESETDTYDLKPTQNKQITDFHLENTTENRIRSRIKAKSRLDTELAKIQEKINNLNLE